MEINQITKHAKDFTWGLTIELSGRSGIGMPRLAGIISEASQARPAAIARTAPMNC